MCLGNEQKTIGVGLAKCSFGLYIPSERQADQLQCFEETDCLENLVANIHRSRKL